MAPDALLSLPSDLRPAFKGPFGPVYTDTETLIEDLNTPVIAVGDIVTWHLEQHQFRPHVAIIDGRTERAAVNADIREFIDRRPNQQSVRNPPGTITEALLDAIATAIDRDAVTTIVVDGEEDLAAVPAVILAPIGATVVYGQPGEGMVPIHVTAQQQATFRALIGKLDGDTDRALSLLADRADSRT